jgi:hypothetical protein
VTGVTLDSVSFAQRSPTAWRTGQLDSVCGPCQWSGATPQLKRLGFDNGGVEQAATRGSRQAWAAGRRA